MSVTMMMYLDQRTDGFWINNKEFLEQHGYRIHPRYDPSWQPGSALQAEEAAYNRLPRTTLADAERISDATQVMLKVVRRDSWELRIGSFFSDPARTAEPRNHCVPLYEVLYPPSHPQQTIIVMPLLRDFRNPPFDTVGEAIECFRQLIEGIQYMHENRVAHRDISVLNTMMDSREMYPHGFNAGFPTMKRDFSRRVSPSARRTIAWPKYYLIDFGHARRYQLPEIPHEEKISGGDRSAPEHWTEGSGCNPFPTDIYYLGNMLRQHFLDSGTLDIPKRIGLEFLRPLVDEMIKERPSERPTIDEVARRYDELTASISTHRLRSPCQVERDEYCWPIRHLVRRVKYTLTGRAALPSHAVPPNVLPETLRPFYTEQRSST